MSSTRPRWINHLLVLSLLPSALSQIRPPPFPSFVELNAIKFPNSSDILYTDAAITHITNETLKYILRQDLLYCPSDVLCTTSRASTSIGGLFPCCQPCSCHANCQENQTCCPDASRENMEQIFITENETDSMDCIHTQFLPFLSSQIDDIRQYMMVSKCKNRSDNELVFLCEKIDKEYRYLDMEHILPVSMNLTAYKNKFCAICNDVDENEVLSWNGFVQCPRTVTISAPTSHDLLRKLMTSLQCNLNYYPSFGDQILSNRGLKCTKALIRSCNVTGEWTTYDAFIEKACESYDHWYRGYYRNVFCFMCNRDTSELFMRCVDQDFTLPSGTLIGNFKALIQYNPKSKYINSEIGQACDRKEDLLLEIYDGEVQCNPPYTYSCGECVSPFIPNNIVYQAYYAIVPSNASTDLYSDIHGLSRAIITRLKKIGASQICLVRFWQSYRVDSQHWKWIVEMEIKGNDSISSVHNLLVPDVIESGGMFLFLRHEKNVSLSEYQEVAQPDFGDMSCIFLSKRKLSKLMVCPYIILCNNQTYYENDKLCLLDVPNVCFDQQDVDKEGDVFHVCADSYFSNITETAEKSRDEIEIILSLTSSVISVVSLLVTLITYSCFSVLRTLPGLNIMALSTSLMISHILYSFGMEQTQLGLGCVILGILTHFSWLCTFMWMNICCIHMFRVFAILPHRCFKTTAFCYYALYSVMASGVIVAAHIIYSYLTTSDIGYGTRICYITESRMILYFFACPLAVIITCNLSLFLTVVYRMHRLPNIKESMNTQRNNMEIYAKLTTLTGITWLLAFLYQETLLTFLSYSYIVLNGCQGLYIMVAFSLNKRSRQLYQTKWNSKKSQSSCNTTRGTVSSEHKLKMVPN